MSKNKRIGRPPEPVPQDIADKVCEWLADGKPLEDLCRQPGMPSTRTVREWKAKDEAFAAAYTRAREDGGHVIAERMRITAATPSDHPDDVQHRRLIIDVDKWLLARWFPTNYGDRQSIEHSGGLTLEQIVAGSEKPEA